MSGTKSPRVLCFGEVLWDLLPSGAVPGGAPLNVAYHLEKLGASAGMISAVGRDELGDQMLASLESRGLNTSLVARHNLLPTGTVGVSLSIGGQPTYTIHEPVAWDEIPWSDTLDEALAGADALVFGSLAARSMANRTVLDRLLTGKRVMRFMDVNLRAPFDDRNRVLALAKQADWLKLNEHELTLLTGMKDGVWPEEALPQVEALAAATSCRQICVTAGERGALLWQDGQHRSVKTPQIRVQDTVGAGDAFTAALVAGLLRDEGGWPFAGVLERACAQGALVASLAGGQPAYEPAAVEALMPEIA